MELFRIHGSPNPKDELNNRAIHGGPNPKDELNNRAIPCGEKFKAVGKIATFFFSYKSSKDTTMLDHLKKLTDIPDNFLGIFALNICQIIRMSGEWKASPKNQSRDILFWLIFALKKIGSDSDHNFYVKPDTQRYFEKFILPAAAEVMKP